MFDDTHKLIELCIKREEKAWAEFIHRFSGLVYYSARERLARNGFRFSEQDIQDIAQNVFVEMWEKSRLSEVRERHKIKAWLSIVSQTRALNYMRKKKERLLTEDELFKVENIVSDNGEANRLELAEELEIAIEPFEPREKIILKLNIIHGKTHKEIAEFMKIPINTVSTIISRKKEHLRKLLRKEGVWDV
ncbi:MAG: sigma-70 family RNA polymerase sigma factor [Candidatus Omnitrophica bacterium]|nr:sigma-70 family RNA polymerase sigma factor [Candidatus Omnitrophota bacterium]